MLSCWSFIEIWIGKDFIWLLAVVISPKEYRSKEPSINGTLIQHNRIFLVISSIASDSDSWITPWWKLFEMQKLHGFCCDQRLLRIIEDMSQCIHSHLIITCVNSHSLFSHSTLISISWRLIVIWEWNNWGTNT